MSSEGFKAARQKIDKFIDDNPKASEDLAKAVSPSIAMLTGLFIANNIIDEGSTEEEIRFLFLGSMLTILEISIPLIYRHININVPKRVDPTEVN